MSVLVQQIETQLFIGKAGGWVTDRADARDFRRAADAVRHCVTEQLKRVRIVMTADDPSLDVFYYPFGDPKDGVDVREPQKKAKGLKKKRRRLLEELKATRAKIAQQAPQLPLRRKKKREVPPGGEETSSSVGGALGL